MTINTQLLDDLKGKFGDIEAAEDGALYISKEKVIGILSSLKTDYGYEMLLDMTAADYEDRFEVVYHLMKLGNAELLKLKVKLEKGKPSMASVMSVWKSADVQEREIYDLMGIVFEGHRHLTRILCPDDFEGHPLRKDFSLNLAARF